MALKPGIYDVGKYPAGSSRRVHAGEDGEPVIEKLWPGRSVPMMDLLGNFRRHPLGSSAAERDVDFGGSTVGKLWLRKKKILGWMELSKCPATDPESVDFIPKGVSRTPCEPGTYNASNPCAHITEIRSIRQARAKVKGAKTAAKYQPAADRVAEQYAQQTERMTEAFERLAERHESQTKRRSKDSGGD